MKTNILRFFFFIFFHTILNNPIFAQADSTERAKMQLKKNAIYASVTPDLLYLGANIYYERIVYQGKKTAYLARAGYVTEPHPFLNTN